MVRVEKEDGKPNSSAMRQFKRMTRNLGFLKAKKRSRFFEAKPNKRKRKDAAIRSARKTAEREYLIKIGKIEERPQFGRGRR